MWRVSRPRARNAATTLAWMAAILATFFIGTSVLARHFGVMPTAHETVLSQLGRHVFGNGLAYFALQYATFAILGARREHRIRGLPASVEPARARWLHAKTVRRAR